MVACGNELKIFTRFRHAFSVTSDMGKSEIFGLLTAANFQYILAILFSLLLLDSVAQILILLQSLRLCICDYRNSFTVKRANKVS